MRYSVSHRTAYTYDEPVTDSLGVAHLLPRRTPWQRVSTDRVEVEPSPDDAAEDLDYYGNRVSYFQVTRPHTELAVTLSAEVEVEVATYDDALLARPWESLRPLRRPEQPGAWLATDFALASAQVQQADGARDYAAASLLPGRPVGEAATDLMHRIHEDFRYDSAATTVTSTIEEILEERAGVCQDFAHLTLACLRSHGLAARYVSGYLATTPPPGRARLVGADASHAWAAVWLGGVDGTGRPGGAEEWLMLDPTNDRWVDDHYVTVAWGRDYADVPPVKGVIFTEAERSTMQVAVDVVPLADVDGGSAA